MPGRSSQLLSLRYLGAVVALAAVVGSVLFGWEFGLTDGSVPLVLGAAGAVVAVGWTVYRRVTG